MYKMDNFLAQYTKGIEYFLQLRQKYETMSKIIISMLHWVLHVVGIIYWINYLHLICQILATQVSSRTLNTLTVTWTHVICYFWSTSYFQIKYRISGTVEGDNTYSHYLNHSSFVTKNTCNLHSLFQSDEYTKWYKK